MVGFCGEGPLLFLGEELGNCCVVVVLPVYLVEGGGDDLGCFREITLDPSVVSQTGCDSFSHSHGQLQGVQFVCLPVCLGISQGLGALGSVSSLPG